MLLGMACGVKWSGVYWIVFFGVLAVMMIGYLLLTSIAKALYVRVHGELL